MALLRNVLGSKKLPIQESNLETGRVFSYAPGNVYTGNPNGFFCWRSPGAGTATIEMWGASGSGSRMCCCGHSVPGNPGGYSRRSISVIQGCYICGCMGKSCANHSSLTEQGCSQPTMLCWFGNGTNGCMCAEGGRSGVSLCISSGSIYCCFLSGYSLCNTNLGTGCGIVCNWCSGIWQGCAYGGTFNCGALFSCTTMLNCNPCCTCCFVWHVRTSAGVFSNCGAIIAHKAENDGGSMWSSNGVGSAVGHFIFSLHAASRDPNIGVPYQACWNSNTICHCYETQGCMPFLPYGIPGPGVYPIPGVRDVGQRGGQGMVRISYNGTITCGM